MTLTPNRPLLPMTGHTRGMRSAATCHFKCGDACLAVHASTSSSPEFAVVAERALSRRSVLAGLGVTALGAAAASSVLTARPAAAGGPATAGEEVLAGTALAFTAIAPVPATVDALTVPEGFQWHPVIRWGDPVTWDAPAFDLDHQSVWAQERQFGYNCDYLAVLPLEEHRALLVANNEYTNENLMFPGYTGEEDLTVDQLRIAMAAHGMSVVEVVRGSAAEPWQPVRSRYGRRITVEGTLFHLTGPAAGSELLRTNADPEGRYVYGTLNNCAGGTTSWGTVLSGEENFNQYFRAYTAPYEGDERNTGYGVESESGRLWYRADPRFDTRVEPQEPNRFGWVVELDPHDPHSTPRKHTALGRFKHEGATTTTSSDGRVVVYMGDDERGQHLYKFVSKHRVKTSDGPGARKKNLRLLEEGDLYVARFAAEEDPAVDYDGTGEWIALTRNGRSQVPGMDLEEVLVFTRQAAAAVGATPMDRPEDVERNPVNGRVYMACTNNTARTEPDPANPRPANKWGHVVEITEDHDDAGSTRFTWTLVLVCGDPADPSTYFAGFPADRVSPISCPDNLAFDADGGLWISTDGQPGSLGLNDALHHVAVDGEQRGRVQQFLAVPTGAETCGPVVDLASGTVFVNVQHPGETDEALVDAPASTFPYDGTADRTPRPSVVQVWRA